MTMTISERLRECANGIGSFKTERGDFGLCDNAADTIDALVEALEAVKPVLAHALQVCDGEGIGPRDEDSDNAIAKIDAALDLPRKET